MYRLERPSMALNDPRVSTDGHMRRYQMENTWDIQANETREHIIEWVATVARGATGRKLKNLVLGCHGLPGYIQLGAGFNTTHIGLFRNWRGLIEKIWLPNCLVARIPDAAMQTQLDHDYPGLGASDGNVFCSHLAKEVQCYVVASTEIQVSTRNNVPLDMMTSFEGLVLSYGPEGNITWQSRNPSAYQNWLGQWVKVPD